MCTFALACASGRAVAWDQALCAWQLLTTRRGGTEIRPRDGAPVSGADIGCQYWVPVLGAGIGRRYWGLISVPVSCLGVWDAGLETGHRCAKRQATDALCSERKKIISY